VAIVVRYFSTTGAGAEDGTTWADRAPFISGGAYSTVLTGFNFGGTDAMEARIGPGNYTLPIDFAAARFTVAAPTARNPLYFFGANSDGTAIAPDYNWIAAKEALNITGFPNFSGGASFSFLCPYVRYRCIDFTWGRNGSTIGAHNFAVFENCKIHNTNSNTNVSAITVAETMEFVNCHFECSGTTYNYLASALGGASAQCFRNCRFVANPSATSGNRDGVVLASNVQMALGRGCTIVGVPRYGVWVSASASAGPAARIINCTIYNCGTAIFANTDAATTNHNIIDKCFIANCTTGIDANTTAAIVRSNRIRVSGTAIDIPDNGYSSDNDTSSGSDSAEFVDAANGDFRIKSTSIFWGKGLGAADEASSGGTSKPVNPFTQTVIS
jgi:hypothetical protein